MESLQVQPRTLEVNVPLVYPDVTAHQTGVQAFPFVGTSYGQEEQLRSMLHPRNVNLPSLHDVPCRSTSKHTNSNALIKQYSHELYSVFGPINTTIKLE